MSADAVHLMIDLVNDAHLALADVPQPGRWAARGRCRSVPNSVFFPVRGENATTAKALCRDCPVIVDCRAYGIEHADLHGVWGGLSKQEREAIAGAPPPPEPEPAPVRASQSERGELYRLLEQLTAHPGQLARVARYATPGSASAMASLLRTGNKPAPPGAWTFDGRVNDETGGSDLYALYHVADDDLAECAS